jgi:hypothetical protein
LKKIDTNVIRVSRRSCTYYTGSLSGDYDDRSGHCNCQEVDKTGIA